MDAFRQDFRFALRTLARNPRVTVILTLTLALGIGATTAIFSMVQAVLLRKLPFEDPNRLVMVWLNNLSAGYQQFYLSVPDFLDFRDQSRVFKSASIFTLGSFTLTGQGDPAEITAPVVSPNFFSALGAGPLLGRTLLPSDGEPGRDHVAVLSAGLWQGRFGADPAIVGKTITLGSTVYTVVGVMPRGFHFPPYFDLQGGTIPWPEAVWLPLDTREKFFQGVDLSNRGALSFMMLARLKSGVTLRAAQSNLEAIGQTLQREYPESNKGWGVVVVPLIEQMTGSVRRGLLILFAACGLLLLIACGNAAGLSVAKAAGRRKEVAVRMALGARRRHIVRQLLVESLATGLLGGALGVALAYAGTPLMVSVAPVTVPRAHESHVNAWVLLFALMVSLGTGLLFGLAPALQASRPNLNEALVEGGRGGTESLRSQRFRGALVAGEIALALVLLIGAGLMMRSFLALESVDPGFDAHGLLTMRVRLSGTRYPTENQREEFGRDFLHRVKAQPGLEDAATVDLPPLSGGGASWTFNVEGQPPVPAAERPIADYHLVSPGYFRVMGIPFLSGRDFSEADGGENSKKLAIVNQTLARRFFPGENPIGKRINLVDPPAAPVWREIIGVAGDVRGDGVATAPGFDVYALNQQPYADFPSSTITLVVRTGLDPGAASAAVRRQVEQLDKQQAVTPPRTMEELLSRSLAKPRLYVALLDLFSFLALALAAVGIYGVVSYSSAERTREIGLRVALGARPQDVRALVLSRGAILAAIGIGVGLAASFALTRTLSSLLYGVRERDPLVFVAVPVLLAAVSLVASYLPARRAARVTPMEALRHE